jgi:hypothetical protein
MHRTPPARRIRVNGILNAKNGIKMNNRNKYGERPFLSVTGGRDFVPASKPKIWHRAQMGMRGGGIGRA